jgi:hypothetical protein
LIITTDSEEKRHGGTSQEVSQEVREQDGEEATRIEGTPAARRIGETLRKKGTSRQAQFRAKEIVRQATCNQETLSEPSQDQEERGETQRHRP